MRRKHLTKAVGLFLSMSLAMAAPCTQVCAQDKESSTKLTEQEPETSDILYPDTQWSCDFLVGDVDHNKNVDLEDASKVLKYALLIEKGNEIESFLADFDADKDIDLMDAKQTLEVALKIASQKKCRINSAYPAYKHDNQDMEPFTKWFYTSDELREHAQMYDDEEYKELVLAECNFLDHNDGPDAILPWGGDGGSVAQRPGENQKRTVITMNVEVPDCEEYFMEYVYNGNRKFLYIYAVKPSDDGKKAYLATYREDYVLADSDFCGTYVDIIKE